MADVAAPPALTPAEFRERHMRTNAPVLLGGLIDGWRAVAEWRVANPAAQSAAGDAAAVCSSASSAAGPSRAAVTDPAAVHQLLLHAKRIVMASIAKRGDGATAAADSASSTAAAATPATSAPPLPSFQLSPPPSTPNFPRLRELFATRADGQPHMVSVAQCFGRSDSDQLEGEGNDVQRSQQQAAADGSCVRQPMDSFLRDWERLVADRARNSSTPIDRRRLRYLKDWHLALTHPHYDAYTPPAHFADDWMNWTMHAEGARGAEPVAHGAAPGEGADDEAMSDDDFRFCYAGPAGTWTPMHSDVYNSYSWSANVVGRKLWLIFAPEWRAVLTNHGQLVHDVLAIESSDTNQLALSLDLLLKSASRDAEDGAAGAVSGTAGPLSPSLPACFVWIQQEGETIFVPSGWLHQVHNLDDCVSINHNWTNACNLPNMHAFLTGEWTAALAAVQGFDFDAGPGAPVSAAPSSNAVSAAPAVLSPELDDTTLGHAWRVMAANVGMSWSQFAHFLRFHRARLQRMRIRSLQLRGGGSDAATSSSPFSLPLEVVDFSLERIDQVEQSMRAEGVDALIARWRQLQEAEAAASVDPVEQLEQQLSRAQVSASAAAAGAVQSESDVSSSDSESSSEEEFVPRHLRPNEGQKRRARVIRDDSDEVESEPEEEEEYDPRAQDEKDAADAVEDSSSSSSRPVSSARHSPLRLPSYPPSPPPPSQCTCPVHPAAAAPAAAASGSESAESGFSVDPTLSYMLRLFFQDVHAAVGLPFMPVLPLDLIASYAAAAAALPVPPTAAAAAASSSHCSAASSSSAPPRVGRGPFLVVLTHYAHGDTFSETHADESELLPAMRAYAAAAMARALEAEREGADETDLKRAIGMLQRLLAQAAPGQHALLDGNQARASSSACAPAPSSACAPAPSPPPPAPSSAPPRSTLDVLMELALDIGDELIQSQLGYGWTLVHECGVDD